MIERKNTLKILDETQGPFIHLCIINDNAETKSFISQLENGLKSTIYVIDSNKCKNRKRIWRSISEIMNFPEYFGHNWDALIDCLTDLEWLQEKGWVLVFTNTKSLFSKHKSKLLSVLIDVLNIVGNEWSEPRDIGMPHTLNAKPFHTVFLITSSEKDSVIELLDIACSNDPQFEGNVGDIIDQIIIVGRLRQIANCIL